VQIVDNKAVLLTTKHPHRILQVIPKAQIVGQRGDKSRVLVHWGLEEAKVLRNIGFKTVPSPIMREYKWPGMFTPMAHQYKTAEFLTLHNRAFVFNDPRTGKTASCAWACDYLMTKKLIKRVLVICPLSIMETAWQSDLFKVLMHRETAIAHGSKEKRAAAIKSSAEFVITNFEGPVFSPKEFAEGNFDLIIYDEANAIKNANTDRWKATNRLLKPDTRIWLLTGTPAAQSPLDAHGLIKMVNPTALPRNYGLFRDMVMHKVTQFKWVPKTNASEIVHSMLQPAIRFTKAECMDLPPTVYTTRNVPLTTQQIKYYNKLKKEALVSAAGQEIVAANAAVLIGKLLQIAAGAVYSTEGKIVEFDIANRYQALVEVIEGTTDKVIVAVPYTHNIQILKERLTADKYSVEMIYGDVSATKRPEIVRRFQNDDDPRVLLIQPETGKWGLTLTRADTVAWWGPTFGLDAYIQFNCRPDKNGRQESVQVVHLQGCPVEEKIYKSLQNKKDIHDDLLEMYKQELLTM
jgi:SNF2 family DNA or RNA helicase